MSRSLNHAQSCLHASDQLALTPIGPPIVLESESRIIVRIDDLPSTIIFATRAIAY